ncbi:MAG: aspartate aminotransferase family protein, partial [Aureispira sp.]
KNKILLDVLNKSGDMYLTHTKINGQYALRLVVAQTYVTTKHVQKAWELIQHHARTLTNPIERT